MALHCEFAYWCWLVNMANYVMLLCTHKLDSLLLVNIVGILACLDGYMNIAMEQTEEYVNGQLKNKYGDAFIRGNNGTRA